MKACFDLVSMALMLTLVAMAAPITAKAQGAIFLNDYDSGVGVFLQNGATLTPAIAGTQIQVLSGSSPNSLTPVFNVSPSPADVFLIGAGDVAANNDGGSAFDGGYGYSSIAAFSEGWIEVTGSVTAGGVFYSGSVGWQQAVGGPQPSDSSLPMLVILAQPKALILQSVPEPSTFDLVGLFGMTSFLAYSAMRRTAAFPRIGITRLSEHCSTQWS